MNFTRLQISVFLGVAAMAWAAVLHFQGVPLTLAHLTPFGTVVGVLALAALLLEHVLWRQRWLHGWFVNRPNLRGTWKVELHSDWIDPISGVTIPPITGFMGVEQTLSALQMHFMTPDSESWFVAHSIRSSPSQNGYQIVGVYTNKPNVHLRSSTSNMHLGAVVIDSHGEFKGIPTTLTAEYWTDRKTTGRMTLTDRSRTVFTRFEDARRDFDMSAEGAGGSLR
jgi:hypothetical protein